MCFGVLRRSSTTRGVAMWGGRDPFDDPFFTGRQERRPSQRGGRDVVEMERRDPFALMDEMMGGSMLGGGFMGGMDMDRIHGEGFGHRGGGGGGGGGSFTMMSSSTVISGDGRSRTVTQRSSQCGAGPFVSERREQIRNGDSETISCGRRINDRSRTITKERDRHGDERTMDTIENMDADHAELDRFDDDFTRHASGHAQLDFGRPQMLQQGARRPSARQPQPQPRALERAYDMDRDDQSARQPRRKSKWGF